jgi:hypothetical protein
VHAHKHISNSPIVTDGSTWGYEYRGAFDDLSTCENLTFAGSATKGSFVGDEGDAGKWKSASNGNVTLTFSYQLAGSFGPEFLIPETC